MTKTLKLKDNPITAAKPEDIPQIAAMAIKAMMDAETPLKPCFEKIMVTVTNKVLQDVCFVRRNKLDPRKIDGFLLLAHQIPDYSLDQVLSGLLFYTKPEFRSFKLAKSLLNAAKKYAIIEGSPLVFDLFTQRDVQQKKKLLKYLGFQEVGSFYFFVPPARINDREEEVCQAVQ